MTWEFLVLYIWGGFTASSILLRKNNKPPASWMIPLIIVFIWPIIPIFYLVRPQT